MSEAAAARFSTRPRTASIASQSLTCMPALTVPSAAIQNAWNTPSVDGAADDELVLGAVQPDVLEPEVVLVGEEVRQPRVRLAAVEHRAGRRLALRDRVVPVLHAHAPPVARVQRRRDVAGREHVRRARAQVLVGHDAVVDLQPGRARPARSPAPPRRPAARRRTRSSARRRAGRPGRRGPAPPRARSPAARRRGGGAGRRRTRRAPGRARARAARRPARSASPRRPARAPLPRPRSRSSPRRSRRAGRRRRSPRGWRRRRRPTAGRARRRRRRRRSAVAAAPRRWRSSSRS